MTKDLNLFYKYVTPSIIGMVIGGSYAIVDTIFIGQASGKNGLAAAAVTWPLVMLLMAFGSLVGAGGAVLLSQSRGAGDSRREKSIFAQTVFLVAVLSITLTTFSFPVLEEPDLVWSQWRTDADIVEIFSNPYRRITLGHLHDNVLGNHPQ